MSADQRLLALLDTAPVGADTGRGWRDLVGGPVAARGRVQDLWQSTGGAGGYDALLAGLVGGHTWVPAAVGGGLLASFVGVAARLGLGGGETVLDLACGPGTLTRGLADAVGPSGLVVGADLSAPMLDRAARALRVPQVTLVRADAMALPLADDTVDAVCCSLCLHLVPDLDVAVAEILRVLRPGGSLALAVPARGHGPWRLLTGPLGRGGQFRMFESGELAAVLRGHGAHAVRTRHDHVLQIVDGRAPG